MKHISSLLVAVICILPLVACDEAPGVSQGTQPTSVAQAPYAVTSVPSPVETAEAQRDVPGPIGTAWLEYPTPGITPPQPVPTITPMHVTLEPARLVSPSIVSTG